MPVRPVLRLPDPVLSRRADEVGRVDDEVRALITDLLDTMEVSPACVGLAAPQIGVSKRVFVADVTGHPKAPDAQGLIVLCDPLLVEADQPVLAREGCMSVPDLTGDVARAARVVLQGLDADGNPRTVEASGFEARALLHELDHLDGLLFLDRVSSGHQVHARKTYK
ncbi:MAG: peptide deformylase [Actinobacteria bacterium]|nr:peptide deformylase [Actinomycetota bacterium]MBV9935693.1 peptide deformylase [Actinomycetota bacterium]